MCYYDIAYKPKSFVLNDFYFKIKCDVCAHECRCPQRKGQKVTFDALQLEFQAVVTCLTCMLGIKLRSSE